MTHATLGQQHALDYLYNLSLDMALAYMRSLAATPQRGRKHRAYVRAYVDTLLAELTA